MVTYAPGLPLVPEAQTALVATKSFVAVPLYKTRLPSVCMLRVYPPTTTFWPPWSVRPASRTVDTVVPAAGGVPRNDRITSPEPKLAMREVGNRGEDSNADAYCAHSTALSARMSAAVKRLYWPRWMSHPAFNELVNPLATAVCSGKRFAICPGA